MTLAIHAAPPVQSAPAAPPSWWQAAGCLCGYPHWADHQPAEHKVRILWMVLLLLSGLFCVEWGLGSWSHSLALRADVGHLLADVFALAMSLWATCLAARPASGRATFGHRRWETLAALVNGLGLLVMAALVLAESVARTQQPTLVLGLPMLLGASLGLAVNGVNGALLYQSAQSGPSDLNLRGAFLHVMTDAASSLGAIIASLTIYFWHWMWMDTAASWLVAGLAAISALPLVRDSLEMLLDYAPRSADPTQIQTRLLQLPRVEQVEQLRVWSVASGQVALCGQVRVPVQLSGPERDQLLQRLKRILAEEFQVIDVTLQLFSQDYAPPPAADLLLNQSLIAHVLGST
jgi:cobalt-zinc-cadmium efflux system protein